MKRQVTVGGKTYHFKTVVVFLQNAYSKKYAGKKKWPRDDWLRALNNSRSGSRLRQLKDSVTGIDWWFDNTTPVVGDGPDSVVPADYRHMHSVLAKQLPEIVVCMGGLAKAAWKHMSRGAAYSHYPVLFLPHPAYRLLTTKLLWEAAELIEDGFQGERELRQERPE